jgi:citrate lyase gamma subunit
MSDWDDDILRDDDTDEGFIELVDIVEEGPGDAAEESIIELTEIVDPESIDAGTSDPEIAEPDSDVDEPGIADLSLEIESADDDFSLEMADDDFSLETEEEESEDLSLDIVREETGTDDEGLEEYELEVDGLEPEILEDQDLEVRNLDEQGLEVQELEKNEVPADMGQISDQDLELEMDEGEILDQGLELDVDEPVKADLVEADDKMESVQAIELSEEQVQAALERLIEKKFGDRVESILFEVLERVIEREIAGIKESLQKDLDHIGNA